MFTGIIEEIGTIQAVRQIGNRLTLSIAAHTILDDLKIGDSVAVNGSCLTATHVTATGFTADVSPETLRVTNLGLLRVGALVNLERALRLADRLHGHLVQGHVDATARLLARQPDGDTLVITIELPVSLRPYIVPKGSIAVDGISLTVNTCDAAKFRCTIIPHTVQQTTLHTKQAGAVVNLEGDLIGRYVENLMREREAGAQARAGLNMDTLREYGWT
jgi:riboflavin synthase